MSEKSQNVQDVFLNFVRKNKTPVTVFLVNGVKLTQAQDKSVHYLRRIPTDPFTGSTDWGERSVQDDPESTSWGGKNVFDVFSLSTSTALDGTKYSDW